jgi:dihydrofolate synthase/folylpolyglutamate synthase
MRRVPFPKFGAGIGLHRVAGIADDLNIDLAALGRSAAAVVGSNGKGSTTAMCASILCETGASVGRFTSPHLFAINERFWRDGADVTDEALDPHWWRVEAAARTYQDKTSDQVGGFEFLFLVAASLFERCAFTIWEAGIGGRFDPVRLLKAPRAALTALDLEHTTLLGDTLEEIAFDKIDAAPSGARLYLHMPKSSFRARIESYCAVRDVTPVFVAADARFAPPLAGAHQGENMALAIALAQDMTTLRDVQIAAGLAHTNWPGRLEKISDAPLIVIDVGHTPDAARRALDGFLEMAGSRLCVLVCGASIDKNAAEMLDILAPAFGQIICAQAPHKGRAAHEIAASAKAANPSAKVQVSVDLAEAHALALRLAGSEGAIYAAGGLFLAIGFKAAHLGLDPAGLDFF